MHTKLLPLVAGILLASTLSACGGSSSSQQAASTGVYKDAGIVSGLKYSTASQSGTTDQNGTFKYMPGETVTFSVSNVTIGQVTGAPTITTFDLVGSAAPLTGLGIPNNTPTYKAFQQALNISLFLQTLDDDSNPENGIAIPAAANSVVAQYPIKFNATYSGYGLDQNPSGFRNSPSFQLFIGSCRSNGVWAGGHAIKQVAIAANALYKGLGLNPILYVESTQTNSYGGQTTSSGTTVYAASGYSIQDSSFDASGTLTSSILDTYDENGNWTSHEFIYDTSMNMSWKTVWVYDANGNNIQEKSYYASNVLSSTTDYTYDINGNEITSRTYDSNGILQNYTLKTYAANGTLSQSKYFDSADTLLNIRNYAYNDDLYRTIVSYIDTITPSLSETYRYTYDSKMNRIKSETFDSTDTLVYYTTYTYDDASNMTGAVNFNSNSVKLDSSVYTYDTNGYWLAMLGFDGIDQPTYSFRNTYDANGNRISSTSNFGSGDVTTVRTFTPQSGWGYLLRSFKGEV